MVELLSGRVSGAPFLVFAAGSAASVSGKAVKAAEPIAEGGAVVWRNMSEAR